jgi:uncharacterized protein YbjQ (UPF0145 family)
VLVVTTDTLPGYEIRAVLGAVVSSIARTRNPYREGVKNLRGGNYDEKAPENLTRWRTDAVTRLGEEAQRLGANAVIGMQFEHREVGEMWMEVCAYGTAVVAVRYAPDPRRIAPPPEPEAVPAPSKIPEPASAPQLSTAASTPTPDTPP